MRHRAEPNGHVLPNSLLSLTPPRLRRIPQEEANHQAELRVVVGLLQGPRGVRLLISEVPW